MIGKRIQSITGPEHHDEYLVGLIRTQISFGLTYLEEARAAYFENRGEFGDAAREITLNSYRSAVRFFNRLSRDADSAVCERLHRFRAEIEAIWPEAMRSREIA